MLRTLEGSALCSVLADRVKEYFKDEENRKKFEIWYQEKYGKPYKAFAPLSKSRIVNLHLLVRCSGSRSL